MPLRVIAPIRRLFFPLARRWIAGETREEALRAAEESLKKGITPLLNFLGEHYKTKEEVAIDMAEHEELLKDLRVRKISASISIKTSEFGLGIDSAYCYKNMNKIISSAKDQNIFVWIDMEAPNKVGETIALYEKLLAANKNNVGLCIQANLQRTATDLVKVISFPGSRIRLVKGAYGGTTKNPTVGSQENISSAYRKYLEILFKKTTNFAVATHDSALIDYTLELQKMNPTKKFEFQFLRGVRNELKKQFVTQGYTVADYIPYGEEWIAYSYRRIKEHPSNIFLIVRSLFERK